MLQSNRQCSRTIVSPTCRICDLESEDITHMLFNCSSLIDIRKLYYSNVKLKAIEHTGLKHSLLGILQPNGTLWWKSRKTTTYLKLTSRHQENMSMKSIPP